MRHSQLILHITNSKCSTCGNRWTHSEVWLAGTTTSGPPMTFGLIPNSYEKKQLKTKHICLTHDEQPICFRCIDPTMPNLWRTPRAQPVPPERTASTPLETLEAQLLSNLKTQEPKP